MLTNESLAASYEQARNAERYAEWVARGGRRLRQAEAERGALTTAQEIVDMARLEREQAAARRVA